MDPLAGYPVVAPPLRGPAVLDQRWTEVSFLHWPVDPHAARRFYPPGTRPDVFDGQTYVGLVPFAMRSAGFARVGGIPYFGSFLETNVRLYSVDDAGRHGVLFLSLDTSRLAVVPLARALLGLPYLWSLMRLRHDGARIEYCANRRWPERGARSRLVLDIGEPVDPTPLEIWLTARWGLHTSRLGRTWWIPNAHPTWSLSAARLVRMEDEFLTAAGIHRAGGILRPLFSPKVRTQFGVPQPL